jgi:hypothetical protein
VARRPAPAVFVRGRLSDRLGNRHRCLFLIDLLFTLYPSMDTAAPIEVYWVIETPDGQQMRCALHQNTAGLEVRLIEIRQNFIRRIKPVADAAEAGDVARGWMIQMLEARRNGYRVVLDRL